MKVSRDWISEFLSIQKTSDIENQLTQLGLEVDSVKKIGKDSIIDIEFTPNRGDCLSVMGVSRDLAAYRGKKIIFPQCSSFYTSKDNKLFKKISHDICPEYRYMKVSDLHINKKTPRFILDRLIKSDITSVNFVVDILNYVMIEIGQPTHAFDEDKIHGKLSIQFSRTDNTFIGINNKEYVIHKGSPVIIDEKNIIHALPGVMGSKLSSVNEETKNIIIESAFFIPDVVRMLSSKYRIQTDSSYRFERGVDFKLQELALARIHNILNEVIPIETCKLQKISHRHQTTRQKSFKYDAKLCKRVLGLDLTQTKIKLILHRLGFVIKSGNITVPSYRFDVSSNYDLVEEVSRVIGYDNIPESPFSFLNTPKNEQTSFNDQLVTLGYKEVVNYSFISKNYTNKDSHLVLDNPISKDKSIMRDSLIPGLLKNINYNRNRQHKSIQLFEAGRIYIRNKNKITELKAISGVLHGSRSPLDLVCNQYKSGIDDIKADLLSLLPSCTFRRNSDSVYFDKENSLKIYINNKLVGDCGLVSASCLEDYDINDDVFAFQILEDNLSTTNIMAYSEISPFPAVFKDITIITKIDDNVSLIVDDARKNSYKYMKNIRIKDIFIDSDKLQLNNRNVTLEVCLQSKDKTLSDEEINNEITKFTRDLKEQYKINIKEA